MLTFIRYIRVNFKFGLQDCVRYIGEFVIPGFVISGFCSVHFTVTLAGLMSFFVTTGTLIRYVGVPLYNFNECTSFIHTGVEKVN